MVKVRAVKFKQTDEQQTGRRVDDGDQGYFCNILHCDWSSYSTRSIDLCFVKFFLALQSFLPSMEVVFHGILISTSSILHILSLRGAHDINLLKKRIS